MVADVGDIDPRLVDKVSLMRFYVFLDLQKSSGSKQGLLMSPTEKNQLEGKDNMGYRGSVPFPTHGPFFHVIKV